MCDFCSVRALSPPTSTLALPSELSGTRHSGGVCSVVVPE